ncbi:hypothetical protein MMC25_000488, partial [Agyrium rufum]|nr:hypothetical protein [Agyrium rufum]
DCKRHVGLGFTRKENLMEHLRRVHRETAAEDEGASGLKSLGPVNVPGTTRPRKRTRSGSNLGEDDDSEDCEVENANEGSSRPSWQSASVDTSEQEVDYLRAEVQKLRRESDLKDQRLQTLENMINKLSQQLDIRAIQPPQ